MTTSLQSNPGIHRSSQEREVWPIVKALHAKMPVPKGHSEQPKITELIGRMICTDLAHYSIVENEGFNAPLDFIELRYKTPSRTHFSKKVLLELLNSISGMSVEGGIIHCTTDIWISKHSTHVNLCATGQHWCEHRKMQGDSAASGVPWHCKMWGSLTSSTLPITCWSVFFSHRQWCQHGQGCG